ncbi:hypothetical protein O2W14_07900 [Modestobacter sp. VKM Ac-2986]|uniref:hypothetical protein n=1 Tax=Modestobacter sp. VKM Ac-2986 TaxID=3004140 RepID=UPI0022AA7128|nr:hypothetical protein [Modestobacter sp. VKM Ac-2986]MCZ2828750.1 hypothetical protein [Modestobacter sp. VKM Ac-2986]
MDALTFLSRLTVWSFAGAALGLLAGLLLVAVGVLDNPFWAASAGILVAALRMPSTRPEPGARRD